MLEHLIDKLKQDQAHWVQLSYLFEEREIPAKTILLNEGEIAHQLFLFKFPVNNISFPINLIIRKKCYFFLKCVFNFKSQRGFTRNLFH
jgi:hypothetical protein